MTELSPYIIFKLKPNCQNSHQLLAEIFRLYSEQSPVKAELDSAQMQPGTGQPRPALCLLGQPLLPGQHHTAT